jgi:hypothetical protein
MKLYTSLIPNRPGPPTTKAPRINAGKAESTSVIAMSPECTTIDSSHQSLQSSDPFPQAELDLILGAESKRIDDQR